MHKTVMASSVLPVGTPNSKISRNGYTRTAVFGQWQKQLQQQQFETACHWTAEIDASGWQDLLWERLAIYASKFVHLHCPKIALLIARNTQQFHTYQRKVALNTRPSVQPYNIATLRKNLCQTLGILIFSAKGPAYQLPKIDTAKVDLSTLAKSTHPWIQVHQQRGDAPIVLQILSTVLHFQAANMPHKSLYWLAVLLETEKNARRRKTPIVLAARQATREAPWNTPVSPKYAHDWVWLLWDALEQAVQTKPTVCIQSLLALRFLFAFNFTQAKKTSRLVLLLHALHMACDPNVDWTRGLYPTTKAKRLVTLACANIDVMYREIHHHDQGHLSPGGGHSRETPQPPPTTTMSRPPPGQNNPKTTGARIPSTNLVETVLAATPPAPPPAPPKQEKARKQQPKKKGKKITMPLDSQKKLDIVAQIDDYFLGGK